MSGIMKVEVGDLVIIYAGYLDDDLTSIDTTGIVTEVVGYKTTVLVEGALQPWDVFDLKTMKLRKEEHETR